MKNKTSENFSKSIDIYKRLHNKYAIVCNLFPRPFGERVRERGYLAASLLSRLAAFTLAEVLITLGIIGVVAAMTMPSLIQNTKEKEVISKLKKFQSLMSQAFLMSVNENGTPDNWGLDANFNIQTPVLSDKFIPYLKVTKDCGLIGKCFYNKDIYFLNNLKWTNLL